MSSSHDGEQSSRSPRRATHDWYITDRFQNLSIQTSLGLPKPPASRLNAMPTPERNEYSNKQSAKVNAGLDFVTATGIEFDASAKDSLFQSMASVANIDFRQAVVPNQVVLHLRAAPSVQQLVYMLLRPPPHAFVHGVLSTQWVMGILGQTHFVFRNSDERHILVPDSSVRREGTRLGFPPVYMEWLCGDDEESSPTEQAMLLTPKYFEELWRGDEIAPGE